VVEGGGGATSTQMWAQGLAAGEFYKTAWDRSCPVRAPAGDDKPR